MREKRKGRKPVETKEAERPETKAVKQAANKARTPRQNK